MRMLKKLQWSVCLGLGRNATHHIRTFRIEAPTLDSACSMARQMYHFEVAKDVPRTDPIWNKMLTVSNCEEIG